jgi:hypothetical protein
MSTRIALGVFAGLVSAVFFSGFLLTGAPIAVVAAYFTALPLFAVGLARGYLMAGVGGITGTTALALLGGFGIAVPFVVAFAGPVVVLVRQALLARTDGSGGTEWYPAGRLALVLAGLALAVMGILLVKAGGSDGGVTGYIEELIRDMFAQMGPQGSAGVSDDMVSTAAILLPSTAAASWMVMMAINGTLAQTLLRRRQWNVRPTGDLSAMHVPTAVVLAAAVGGLLFWQNDGWLGAVGSLVVAVVAVIFLFQGLAVVHTVSRSWS